MLRKGKSHWKIWIRIFGCFKHEGPDRSVLPPQPISPIQLHKLQGKERKKASGEHKANSNNKKILTANKDDLGW